MSHWEQKRKTRVYKFKWSSGVEDAVIGEQAAADYLGIVVPTLRYYLTTRQLHHGKLRHNPKTGQFETVTCEPQPYHRQKPEESRGYTPTGRKPGRPRKLSLEEEEAPPEKEVDLLAYMRANKAKKKGTPFG